MAHMPPKLKDIASVANVSISTVSRALNGHPALNDATITRIRDLASEMGYASRRSGRRGAGCGLQGASIGVISLGMDRSLVAIPAISSALNGAETALASMGAHVSLAHIPDLAEPPQSLMSERLDGVILTGAMQGESMYAASHPLLDKLRLCPTVWVVGRPKGAWGDAVVANDYQVGEAAADHLADLGHRSVAFVNPKPDHLLFMRREDGFRAGAARRGLEARFFCEAPVGGWTLPLRPPLEVETVQALVDRMLDLQPRPTAIFAAADSVATLVYRALAVHELRVGRDISVISGNNDAAMIAGLHPHLTTFDIHAEEIGRLAVRHLAMVMADGAPRPGGELMLDTTLVAGESVARIEGA